MDQMDRKLGVIVYCTNTTTNSTCQRNENIHFDAILLLDYLAICCVSVIKLIQQSDAIKQNASLSIVRNFR